nr:MAG TPA: hypothetical protein [Caudoviricetes sp.]
MHLLHLNIIIANRQRDISPPCPIGYYYLKDVGVFYLITEDYFYTS